MHPLPFCYIIRRMKALDQDLKNGIFKNIYLLYGSQAYLRNQYRDKIVNALIPSGDTVNLSQFQGEGVELNEIIDLAETMPFFADRRVIVVENSGLFASSNDKLAEYIPLIPESTTLVFSEEKVDGKLKAVKAVKSNGTAVDFKEINEQDLRKWVSSRFLKEHRPINERAFEMFINNCGTDMMFINTEMEKLISYTLGKDGIYPQDVEAICTVQIEDKIFLMLDEMFSHNMSGALHYYSDLMALQQPPIRIMALIENQLRLLLHVKQLSAEGLGASSIAKTLGMNEFRVKKALSQAGKSSKIWIMKGLELCADIDEASKSGRIAPQIGLETIICSLSENVNSKQK